MERIIGYALPGPERAEALPHLDASLRLAQELGATYERRCRRSRWQTFRRTRTLAKSEAALARLGVVRVPRVPLP